MLKARRLRVPVLRFGKDLIFNDRSIVQASTDRSFVEVDSGPGGDRGGEAKNHRSHRDER
jgi:hypothetical protein